MKAEIVRLRKVIVTAELSLETISLIPSSPDDKRPLLLNLVRARLQESLT